MIYFNLERPVELHWAGEFISPESGWKHLTRTLLDYELVIVTEGEFYIGDENEEYAVQAGEYLIMPPTRCQQGTRECKCRFYWMHFGCPALPASLSLPAYGKFTDAEKIHTLMKSLFKAELERHCGIHSHYLATGILLLLASANGAAQDAALPPPDKAQALCNRIKNVIASKRFSDVRVREIARELGYHEKYLSAVFRETEGITIKRYLSCKRMEEAKRVLLETNLTVAEVAYYLNFENPHNFSRFFKTEEGMTPLDFRKNARDK